MSLQQPSLPDVDLRDAGFVVAWLLAFVLLVPVQLASMIGFDATGLDTAVPDVVFMAVVPALLLAVVPTLVARRLYGRRATGATAAVAVVSFALVAAYVAQFYGFCGPDC